MQWLIKYRWFFLLLAFTFLPFLWPGIEKAVQVDNRLSIWFLEGDEQLQGYEAFQEKFGNDELLFILIRSQNNVLEDDFLNNLSAFSDSLSQLQRVEHVLSVTNLKIPDGSSFGMSRFTSLQNEKFGIDEREQMMQEFPGVRSILFNADYSATALLIQPTKYAAYEAERADFIAEIKNLSRQYFTEKSLHFAGTGVIYDALNQLSEQQFALFLSIAFLLIFLMMLLIYRQSSVLIYVLLVIILANCFTLGIYGLAGLELNLMSGLIPIIISLLGVLDIVHLLNQHQKIGVSDNSGLTAIKSAFKPCLFTSLTTMVGFLTLYVSPMPILRDFGLFAAVGIFFSLIFSFLLAPIFLTYIKMNKYYLSFSNFIPSIQFFSLKRQHTILLVTAILILISFLGLLKIETDSDTLGYFSDDHKVMQDSKMIEAHYGAYLPIEYLITANDAGEQAILNNTFTWTKAVGDQIEDLEKNIGFHTLYESAFKMEFQDKWQTALKSKGIIDRANGQIKKNYPDLYQSFTHEEGGTYRVTFFTKMLSANEMTSKIDRIDALANQHFDENIKISPAGFQPMYATIISYVINTQVYSLLLAFLLVFLLLWWMIKNIGQALLATFINLIPVAVIFGVMGWFHIDLDTVTASLAAIILCICVDDTIHFIHHFNRNRNLNQPLKIALDNTLQSVGVAILLSSLLLFLGFGSMIFASLKTVFYFGLLISIAVLTAALSQLYLFPVLLLKLGKRNNQ